jgi:hypothetical protein
MIIFCATLNLVTTYMASLNTNRQLLRWYRLSTLLSVVRRPCQSVVVYIDFPNVFDLVLCMHYTPLDFLLLTSAVFALN